MPLVSWSELKTSNAEILKLQNSEGDLLAVAIAGRHPHSGTQMYYGCSWQSYEQNGDLSCGSRYYRTCDLFPLDQESDAE